MLLSLRKSNGGCEWGRAMANEISDQPKRIVVITGMSGSGKHTAFKAFEDLGYFCVDNLPTALVPRLVEMTIQSGGKINRLAVTVDARLGESSAEFKRLFRRLKRMPFDSQIVFFDASDRVLAQRYSETRRVHPLARNSSLLEGFGREREAMLEIRELADMVVDTTDLSTHDLRRLIYERFRPEAGTGRMVVTVISFGYKRGIPYNCDLVFDVRFLPNPYFVSGLREQTGCDRSVVEFMEAQPESAQIIGRIDDMLEYLLPRYAREGKTYCTLGIGCTGGKHRSVYVAGEVAERLTGRGFEVNLIHRDMQLE